MRLWTVTFKENGPIPIRNTCDGENVNPHLAWEYPPVGTQSFMVTMSDQDALLPFTHWIVVNIPPSVHEIEENSIPQGAAQLINNTGHSNYRGPCPPQGTHHYVIKLYAIDLPKVSSTDLSNSALFAPHILATAALVGIYAPEFAGTQLKVWSPAFKDGEKIPEIFTCEGANVSPPLQWDKVPRLAKSLALVVENAEPTNGIFTNWIVINIHPATSEILLDSLPIGATQLKNSSGKTGYVGPCPKLGPQRYVFRLFALDVARIIITNPDSIREVILKHKIAEGSFLGHYERSWEYREDILGPVEINVA